MTDYEDIASEIRAACDELERMAETYRRGYEAEQREIKQLWAEIAELRDDLLTTRNLIGKVKDAA